MERRSLRRCLVHNKKSFIYCRVCKRAVCSNCGECESHVVTTINRLLNEYGDDLTPGSLRQYRNEVSRLLDSIKLDIGISKREFRKKNENIKEKREMVAHSRKGVENDLALIEEAINYLREVQGTAYTDRLRRSCENAIHELDIQKEIENEIRRYSGGLEELEKALEEERRRLKVLEEKRYLLERVGSGETEEGKLALVLYLEKIGQGYKINCSIPDFRAMTGVKGVFDIDEVMKKRLIDVGEGIMISEPLVVEKGLKVGRNAFFASLSRQGILAIHSYDRKDIVQFTNLRNGKQVEVEVEYLSNVAFYDDKMILLTYERPLREARVEEVFNRRKVSVFKRIGAVDEVRPDTDTSLLHSRRILCYKSTDYIPYEYNVDTRENKRIEIEQKVYMFSSLMGIDCGVKAVLQDWDNRSTYALNWDNKVIRLHETKEWGLTSLFASSTHPKDLTKSVLRYSDYLIKGGNRIDPRRPIYFGSSQSVIRVYKDIFLLYNWNTWKWVLSRIIVS